MTREHDHDDSTKQPKVRAERNKVAAAQAYAAVAIKNGRKVPKMVRSIIEDAKDYRKRP